MINRKLLAIAAGFSVLHACSSIAQVPAPKLEVFTGRLEFSGEFNLFPFPASGPRGKECISGVFSLSEHLRIKKLYNGKLVTLFGTKASYVSLTEEVGTERGWRGAQLPNYCGGEYVILAEKVELSEQP